MIPGIATRNVNGVEMSFWSGVLGCKLHLVNTMDEWRAFYGLLMQQQLVACDTEGTGFYWYTGDRICGLSFGWKDMHFYVPLRHKASLLGGLPPPQLDIEDIRADLQAFFGDTTRTTIWHNCKFDLHFYAREDIKILTKIHDTRILWHFFNENAPGKLKVIAAGWKDELGRWHEGIVSNEADQKKDELDSWRSRESKARRMAFRKMVMATADIVEKSIEHQGKNRNQLKKWIAEESELSKHEYAKNAKDEIDYSYIPVALMTEYAALDTFLTYQVYAYTVKNIQWNNALSALYKNEMTLLRILFDAEEHGVRIDRALLEKAGKEFDEKIAMLKQKIIESVGDINLQSTKQLADSLIEAGVKLTKVTKASVENPEEEPKFALDKKVLEKLKGKHEIINDILELRKYAKLKGTYVEGILAKLSPDNVLHCSFNQNVKTGRMCIAQGTKVQMPCDRSVYPDGKPIEDVKVGDSVYCYDTDGNLHLRKVLWAGCKGEKETVTIHWRGHGNQHSGSLTLTPDHRVRLFDGSWVEAAQLTENDSIMALSARQKGPEHDRYVHLYGRYSTDVREHVFVATATNTPKFADDALESNHRVTAVTKAAKFRVYDLEVEEYNNFIAGELCVHNSSQDPNLQNIPAEDKTIRKSFLSWDPEEYDYILADYSQVEVRLTAHYSQDALLLDAYAKGQDIHTRTFCEMFGYEIDFVNKVRGDKSHPQNEEFELLRTVAKRINFGIIYGIGAPGLSEQVKRPLQYKDLSDEEWVQQCQKFIDQYLSKYVGVKRFVNQGKRMVSRDAELTNYFGRVRHLPNAQACKILKDKQMFWMEARAQRQGVNFLVQGCQDPAAPVLTTVGYIPINKLEEHGKPPLVTYTGTEQNYDVLDTGDKECVEVVTSISTGVCSTEHKFFVLNPATMDLEFRSISDLPVGSQVVAMTENVVGGVARVSTSTAELLGILIGDGSYGIVRDRNGSRNKEHIRNVITIACGLDVGWAEYVRDLIRRVFPETQPTIRSVVKATGNINYLVGVENKAMREHLQSLGLSRVVREHKIVPTWLHTQPRAIRAAALKGLMDTDGGINSTTIGFTNKSRQVAESVQLLLQSLGIQSRFKTDGDYFRVLIRPEHLARYAEVVKHELSYKTAHALKHAVTHYTKSKVPHELLVHTRACLVGSSLWKSMTRSERVAVKSLRMNKYTAIRLLSALEGDHANLIDLLSLDWATILNVSPRGVLPTMDLELHGKDHSYICRGLVQHNTAADLFKIAIVRTAKILQGSKSHIVNFVHDEIQMYIHKDDRHLLSAIKRAMEDWHFSVPIIADFSEADPSWGVKKGLVIT